MARSKASDTFKQLPMIVAMMNTRFAKDSYTQFYREYSRLKLKILLRKLSKCYFTECTRIIFTLNPAVNFAVGEDFKKERYVAISSNKIWRIRKNYKFK